jgi:hypothetical protein
MTIFGYFSALYRIYRKSNSRPKAAFMALREAIKPLPF